MCTCASLRSSSERVFAPINDGGKDMAGFLKFLWAPRLTYLLIAWEQRVRTSISDGDSCERTITATMTTHAGAEGDVRIANPTAVALRAHILGRGIRRNVNAAILPRMVARQLSVVELSEQFDLERRGYLLTIERLRSENADLRLENSDLHCLLVEMHVKEDVLRQKLEAATAKLTRKRRELQRRENRANEALKKRPRDAEEDGNSEAAQPANAWPECRAMTATKDEREAREDCDGDENDPPHLRRQLQTPIAQMCAMRAAMQRAGGR
eukprot:Opistho-1_new@11463